MKQNKHLQNKQVSVWDDLWDHGTGTKEITFPFTSPKSRDEWSTVASETRTSENSEDRCDTKLHSDRTRLSPYQTPNLLSSIYWLFLTQDLLDTP